MRTGAPFLPTACVAAALLASSCAMTWEECFNYNDCPARKVCINGLCVAMEDASSVEEEPAPMELPDMTAPGDAADAPGDRRADDARDTAADAREDPRDASDPGSPDATDGATCPGGCSTPPGQCYESAGTCVAGECRYGPKPHGSPCSDSDTCTVNDACNGAGSCAGSAMDCARPHTTGGRCESGHCTGFACERLWGDCNSSWDDGCEASLTTGSRCGSCSGTCEAGANATASCATGTCQRSCASPWQNCDGAWANGCEIPAGVADRCDKYGLNSGSGCGTPYCGSSSSDMAANFGNWYCLGCASCHHFSDGWSWCLHLGTSGGEIRWSGDRCPSCCNSSWEDKVCSP